MPEGPSIFILKELIQDLKIEGKKITAVSGDSKIDMDRLLNKKIKSIKSWGKHFLICFDDFTVRVHLMMFGSYRINERKKSPVRLSITAGKNEVNFYTCSVKILEGTADENYDWTADIMSEKWDEKKAVAKVKKQPDLMVCDVLLDQNIFAGSGNIIKNEVLYRSNIHPETVVQKLPPAKLKELVKETSKYSFDFLTWKKENTLKKHWLIYTKKNCPKGHSVDKKYTGKGKRRTFFCKKCQKKYGTAK